MKNEFVINNVGKTFAEAMDNIESAEITLGILHGSLVHMIYYPKAFVQRRKIGGNDALLYLVHCDTNRVFRPNADGEHNLGLGRVIQIGMLIFTAENAMMKEQQLLLSSKAYATEDMATMAWSHQVKVLQEELLKEAPIHPIVTKMNYDVIEAVPANEIFLQTQRLLATLRQARSDATSFAPTEALDDILRDIEDLFKPIYVVQRKAKRILDEQFKVIQSL